jgi:5-(aminomethyl)-3-furanmethanol phosphate kinase
MTTSTSSKSSQPGPAVIKVGGSLLEWPELPRRLEAFLNNERRTGDPSSAPIILIAGGGPVADLIRTMDRIHGLGEEQAHWLAIDAMNLSAGILAALLPGAVVVDRPDAIDRACDRGQIAVLAPRRFLEDIDNRRPDPLPASWDVTSDSIAARIATGLNASRLVLLKSASLTPGAGLAEAARLGLIDPVFPSVARELKIVEYVCLREAGTTINATKTLSW